MTLWQFAAYNKGHHLHLSGSLTFPGTLWGFHRLSSCHAKGLAQTQNRGNGCRKQRWLRWPRVESV